jgi:membrane-bound serine protease (ClpP class)
VPVRRLIATLCALVGLLGASPAVAGGGGGVDVVVVDGFLDGRMTEFLIGAVENSDAQVIVVQLDSSATLDGDVDALLAAMEASSTPIAVYAGPDPAHVAGAAVLLLADADISGAAPGVLIGPASPLVAGASDDSVEVLADHPDVPEEYVVGTIEVGETDPGDFFDLVTPSIGQFVVGIDGFAVGDLVVETAEEEEIDGQLRTVPSVPITFVEPGLIDATIRVGTTPEAAFFFLVAGFALAAFEFYAAGPGLAAAVAAICLLLGGYGVAVLPVRWWAIALVPLALLLYTVDFQRNDLGWKSIVGTGALFAGGYWFTDAAPQIDQSWWVIALVVVCAALWFGFALTTVVRARFSTQTIGRDHLIGRRGTAASAIAPEGVVTIDDARWRARSSRASGISAGDPIEITAVEGVVLEVEPVSE